MTTRRYREALDHRRGLVEPGELVWRDAPERPGQPLNPALPGSRIGVKSFDLAHVISASGGRVVAEAKSVLVSYDYERGESVAVPDELGCGSPRCSGGRA